MRRLQQFEGFQIGRRITSFNPFEEELAQAPASVVTAKSPAPAPFFANVLGAPTASATAAAQPQLPPPPPKILINILDAPVQSTEATEAIPFTLFPAPASKGKEAIGLEEEGVKEDIPMFQPRDKEGKRLLYKHPKLPSVGPRGAYWLLVGTHDKSAQAWLLQFDGAANPNPGPASSGAVLWGPPLLDGERRVVFESGKFLGKATNNLAEIQGLLLGLQIAAMRGARDLLIEGDSELIIFQQTGKYQVKDRNLKRWWAEIQAAMMDETAFDWIAIRQVPREQNERADSITKEVLRTKSNFTRAS